MKSNFDLPLKIIVWLTSNDLMKVLFLLVALLCSLSFCDDRSSVPGWVLHNQNDLILTWRQKRLSFTREPDFPAGVSSLRLGPSFHQNSLHADSFAFNFNGHTFGPTDYDLSVEQLSDGSLQTCVLSTTSQPFPFTLCRTLFFPPNEPFYLSRFSLDAPPSVSLLVLEFIITQSNDQSKAFGWRDTQHGGQFMVDLRKLSAGYLSFDTLSHEDIHSYQLGPSSGPNSPLNRFMNKKELSGEDVWEDEAIMLGLQYNVTSSGAVTSFRALRNDWSPAVKASDVARSKSYQNWLDLTKSYWNNWYSKTVKPKDLPPNHQQFFRNCLYSFKYGQNPLLGAITASFHPSYDLKVWSRDAIMASIILTSTGHFTEARKFLEFMAEVELTDSHFHTTYSLFDGSIVWFVEPQVDSAGAFPLAVLYYLEHRKTNDLSGKVNKRIFELMDKWVENVKLQGFGKADYSIWEESSSPHDGSSLPTEHFTFSQAMGHAGLVSASKIAERDGMKERSEKYLEAAEKLENSIISQLWSSDDHYFGRSLSQHSKLDTRVDSSTTALIYTGLVKGTKAKSHLDAVKRRLTRSGVGISRYEGDIFFYKSVFNPNGQEASNEMPPWTVTTMFTALAELTLNPSDAMVKKRLDWMVLRSARFNMPIGEAADHEKEFIWSGAPDIYESCITCLVHNVFAGLAKNLNPNELKAF
ncbi:hypothetical protein P9112_001946 [Eukaryota sp. TZLM1-RC]